MREVGEEHRRGAGPGAQVTDDVDLTTRHDLGQRAGIGAGIDAVVTRDHAVVGDLGLLRVEQRAARPELGEDATPVGVFTVERALHELRSRNTARSTAGILHAASTAHREAHQFRGAFCITSHLFGERSTHVGQCIGEGVHPGAIVDRYSRCTVGEHQHRVVGTHRTVDQELVERLRHRLPKGGLEGFGVDGHVGGERRQHRGHRR